MAEVSMNSSFRGILIILIGLIIGFLVVWQFSIPVRHRLAERQIDRGDVFLLAQDYSGATVEYQKALSYEKTNTEAEHRLELAKEGPVDIVKLRQFYLDHKDLEIVTKIDQATKSYTEPKEALKAGVELYSAKEFVYAQYPIQEAIRLDPDYPEAWHYLGLTYQQLAKIDPNYTEKAADAWEHRDALTPKYL